MKVEISNDVKDFEVYETEKCKFRIGKDQLDDMKEKKDFEGKIRKKVMKNMKIKTDTITGQIWEESWKSIVEELI